jgi:nucleoid-associated protein YgaU
MTSQRSLLARGISGALGVLGLLTLLCSATAHAADPPKAGAPAAAPAGAAPAPSGAPPAPAEAAAPAAAGGGAADQGAYTVRLRSLEKNVNELKEQIFRTKARLNLLKETVLGGVIGASRAIIRHKNEMGSSYRLIQATYALDGVQIFSKSDDSGRLAEMTEFDVYNGAIQPGSHTLSVVMLYQGNGFGVFSYLKGYKFKVKSSHTFVAGESKTTNITVVGYEKGNITTQLSDKPAVDFRVNVIAAGESGATAAAPKK